MKEQPEAKPHFLDVDETTQRMVDGQVRQLIENEAKRRRRRRRFLWTQPVLSQLVLLLEGFERLWHEFFAAVGALITVVGLLIFWAVVLICAGALLTIGMDLVR